MLTDRQRKYQREWRAKRRAVDKEFKDKCYALNKEWRDRNKEALKVKRQQYLKDNKAKVRERGREQEQARYRRRMKWDRELTALVEIEAKHLCLLRKEATGVSWQKDHILPLMGKSVSGLHVWNNIQVLPEIVNKQKYNSVEYYENWPRY